MRDVTKGDLPSFFEHQFDPVANEMAAFTARDEDEFMAHWTKILNDDTVVTKTVLFDDRVAGNVVSFERDGEREVGYWIGREFWGQGIATKALLEFLRHVTARPLFAHVATHNIASIRVLEKCGFVVYGEAKTPANERGEEVEEFILKLG